MKKKVYPNRKLPNLPSRLGNFRVAIRQLSVFALYYMTTCWMN